MHEPDCSNAGIRLLWVGTEHREILGLSRLIVTMSEFQELADQRLAEAKALLDHGQWDGSYYLAGYAVELGLKACIIKTLLATDAFPDKEFSKNCYTHAVEKLVGLAKLEGSRKAAMNADPDLLTNWALVRDWSEEKRYHRIDKTESECSTQPLPTPYTGYSHGSKHSGERADRERRAAHRGTR